MALCVRKLRAAPALGNRWRNGARGAGGAAGRLREGNRFRAVTWDPELSPRPRIPAPHRHPLPSVRSAVLPQAKHEGSRMHPSQSRHVKALRQLQEILQYSKGQSSTQLIPYQPGAKSVDICPLGRESWYLSSAQLDCFRSLFEPGVCRTPYQDLACTSPSIQKGVLAFQLSKKVGVSPSPGGNQEDMEQHLAIMHAKLREELPMMMKRLDFSIYRKDVEFVSSMLHIHTRGLVLYQLLVSLSRLLFLSYFSNTHVSVLKLTTHPETCSIQARWSVSGLPLHSVFFYIFRTDKAELYSTYDAHSTFYLAADGLIRLHKLEQVMPSAPLTLPKKTVLAAALIALGLGEHRPALNLLSSRKIVHKL
ncbi:Hypothetical predicted protein [Pelobates cultripes]|uniref:Uncharacterized protein n=1 Tax=Pelobates cultripes TaxID=61616 RepID=A0AAD1WMU5_PELCU|nr:Hypothetical predicted protein [Pelobates cultripes]